MVRCLKRVPWKDNSKGRKEKEMERLDYYMKLRYKILLTPIPIGLGGGWDASIPRLGSDMYHAWGQTIEEALRELEQIKRDLFDDYIKSGIDIAEPEEVK